MPRAKRRPLPSYARDDLARGLMRRWQGGDTASSLAERLTLPEHRIQQAIAAPLGRVAHEYRAGVTADDIADALALPRAFVVYAIKRITAQRVSNARRHREVRS